MTGLGPFEHDDDAATPLTPDERQGLIPTYITTRAELNEAEHLNITDAEGWLFQRRRNVLDIGFLRRLHRRMFGQVWRWAGAWTAQHDRRLGVDSWSVEPELQALIEAVAFWIAHDVFDPDEIAARFHHKLTWIHPFPNGNGRFARLATDRLLVSLGRPRFTWGGAGLIAPGAQRAAYVAALRAADNHDLRPLLAFVRT